MQHPDDHEFHDFWLIQPGFLIVIGAVLGYALAAATWLARRDEPAPVSATSSGPAPVSVVGDPVVTVNEHAPPASLWDRLEKLTTNQLVLLILGAALSTYLIPKLANQTLERQKELDLKAALVASISQDSTNVITTSQSYQESTGESVTAYNQAYETWLLRSGPEGAKLAAYFPSHGHTDIAGDWQTYVHIIAMFHRIVNPTWQASRPGYMDDIRADLLRLQTSEREVTGTDSFDPSILTLSWPGWKEIQNYKRIDDPGTPYAQPALELRDEILAGKDAIVREIVSSTIPEYTTSWP